MTDSGSEMVYTVAQLTRAIKEVLEGEFTSVWVEGEISNYLHHTSGHRYFTLKDSEAQLKAVIWKFSASGLSFQPKDGLKVRAFGDITLYEKGGYYQLRVIRLLPQGKGSLEEQFQRLKAKLAAEGLFDEERKRAIPQYPQAIGIVTSPTGAAVRDILNICRRRAPMVRLILRPTKVQGDGAAEDIADAIREFNQFGAVDTLIVGRGGGSLEDLWAFNEETVARAIFASEIPVISAVGHEIDFSIADFVADLRAATPSAAAELATFDATKLVETILAATQRLTAGLRRHADRRRERWQMLQRSQVFAQPLMILEPFAQQRDEAVTALTRGIELQQLRTRNHYERLADRLQALSPLRVLERGYAVVRRRDDSRLVKSAGALKSGDEIAIEFVDGRRDATIE